MTRKEFYTFIENNYKPSIYEIDPEAILKAGRHAYGYSGIGLYYEIYKLLRRYIKDNAKILDIGGYPGTFLSILQITLKDIKAELSLAGLFFAINEASRYRNLANENPDTKCIATDLGISNFMRSLNVKTHKINLDYCDSYNFLNKDNSQIEELSGEYDIITCMETIEHLHTPYRLFDLLHRFIKKGGICVLETNNIRNLWGIKRLFMGGSNLDTGLCDKYKLNNLPLKATHVRFYSIREIKSLFAKSGFRVIKAYDFNWCIPLRYIKDLKSKIIIGSHLLNIIPGFKSHIVLLAEKL